MHSCNLVLALLYSFFLFYSSVCVQVQYTDLKKACLCDVPTAQCRRPLRPAADGSRSPQHTGRAVGLIVGDDVQVNHPAGSAVWLDGTVTEVGTANDLSRQPVCTVALAGDLGDGQDQLADLYDGGSQCLDQVHTRM